MRSSAFILPSRWPLLPSWLACLLAAATLSCVEGSGPGACYTHCHVLWVQCDLACGGGSTYQGYDCTIACLEEKAACFQTCLIGIHIAGLLFPAFPAGEVDSGGGEGGADVSGYASVAAAAASIRPGLPGLTARSRLGAGLNRDYSSIELAVGQADALLSTMGGTRLQHSVYAEREHDNTLALVLPTDKSNIQVLASDVRGGSQHWQQGTLFRERKAKHETENLQVSRFLGRWGTHESSFRFFFDGKEEYNIIQVSVSDLLFEGRLVQAKRHDECDYISTRITVRSLRDADFTSALLGTKSGSTKGQINKSLVCLGASMTIEAQFDGVTRKWVFQGCSTLAYLPNAARAWNFSAAFDAVLECHVVGMSSKDFDENSALEWFTSGITQTTATVGGYTYSGVLPVRYTFPLFTSDPFNGIPGHTETDSNSSDQPSALVRAVEELEIRVNRLEL